MNRLWLVLLAGACSGGDGSTHDRYVNNSGLDGSVSEDSAPDSGTAALSSSQTLLSFGTVLTDTRSSPLTTTISNPGDASTVASLAISGAGAASFLVDTETCVGTTVRDTTTCAIGVRFAPAAAGAVQATLTVSGTATGTTSFTLKGTGATAGALAFAPTTGPFGNVTAATSSDINLQVQNVGATQTGTITIDVSGTDASLFQVTANNCGGGLAASATCMLVVRFSPTTTGARMATLTASDALGGSMTAALSGTGI